LTNAAPDHADVPVLDDADAPDDAYSPWLTIDDASIVRRRLATIVSFVAIMFSFSFPISKSTDESERRQGDYLSTTGLDYLSAAVLILRQQDRWHLFLQWYFDEHSQFSGAYWSSVTKNAAQTTRKEHFESTLKSWIQHAFRQESRNKEEGDGGLRQASERLGRKVRVTAC